MQLRLDRRAGRRLVLVVGIGRSGTSAFTSALASFGVAVPQPEVSADETNPRGFGEPQWAVDFHTALLRRVRVSNFDGRPGAWELTDALAADDDDAAARLRDWLTRQLDEHGRVVVKDPRTVWLLSLWNRVADELDLAPSYVTVLRHPAEVVASAKRAYGEGRHEASRVAGWVNVMVHAERATRGRPRSYVGYDALLTDWRSVLATVDTDLGLGLDLADASAAARVDGFIDPALRREQVGWEALELPVHLQAVADRTWAALGPPPDLEGLERCREDYVRLYDEAELVAQWSIAAAAAAGRQAGRRAARQAAQRRSP